MKSRESSVSIEFDRRALRDLAKLPRRSQEQIVEAIERLKEKPLSGRQLSGPFHNLRRIRVGDYRVIYHFKEDKLLILVLRIGHRKNVYRIQ